ncbi:acyl-CoA dehydrogenase [Leeuwenhoekiella polynyae]|uniref:Alkylation response protein AidB-like acyl-CoA dehydrogenase n=1 Tax=Leeuwenhoekiella polynyae TaxID=1550906 RepID=A0A4Q0NNB1_9FLAO|nr:acyl-CoA dehydrogenase [Leeuwenhoekiella polynyae]RXG11359.1 hypothetical protein DSM02_4113 [Leeuwenhoekiella polynyae]
MNNDSDHKLLSKRLLGAKKLSPEILEWITSENLWNIWVPKSHGGLELTLTEGLHKLKELAQIDGSLGWTVTLCSGANYFIGNMKRETAQRIFIDTHQKPILGGSGGLFGVAEKTGDQYKLSGTWKYATGGPYLTHVTVNAKIKENGKELLQEDGSPLFKSFVIPKAGVNLIDDWNTMGMQASRTCSFSIDDLMVEEADSFQYDQFNLPNPIFKVNFRVFADLTLWVNYIGMATHFKEEVLKIDKDLNIKSLKDTITKANQNSNAFAETIEQQIELGKGLTAYFIKHVHETAAASMRALSQAIIEIYPHLGINAARENQVINQIFRDYFTATQHRNFTR